MLWYFVIGITLLCDGFMSGGTVWFKCSGKNVLFEEMAKFYAAELTLAEEIIHKYGTVHW
jgi:hypothetical protein